MPITPQNAVKMYQGQLSNYELSEVLDYPQIYYVGTGGQKVRNTSVNKVRRPLAPRVAARADAMCEFACRSRTTGTMMSGATTTR